MMDHPFALPLLAAALLATGAGGCAADPDTGGSPPVSGRAAVPVVRDVTHCGTVLPDDARVPDTVSTHVVVPWDSHAVLEVSTANDAAAIGAGALVVRYGKSWTGDARTDSTIYVLERAGPAIEAISLQWQPPSGYELRAIARVDGTMRCYDFDR